MKARHSLASTAVLIGALALYALPVLFMFQTSLREQTEVFSQAFALVFRPTTAAYEAAFQLNLGGAVLASVRITVMTTGLTLLLATPAAYALSRMHGRWLGVGLAALILLQLVPAATLVIPLYKVLFTWGLLGSVEGVVVASVAHFLPFTVLLLRPFFLSVPLELEDAAAVDGAGRLRTFIQVVLPIARNGTITVGVLLAMIVWGDFLFAVTLLVNPADYPLSTLLTQQVSNFGTSYPTLMALVVISSAPIVVLFLLMQKRLAQGLSLGAVK